MSSPHDPADLKVSIRSVYKRFNSFVVLDDVTMDIRKGEFVTLLGPSGSGKTTILNIISGAIDPSSGKVFIGNADAASLPPGERGLGMVFQNYALMPHMTVYENIAFPLRIRGWDKAKIKISVTSVLERVGLERFSHRKPRELSGGQQQRVGIARCLVYGPEIILMDEPLGALDKNLRDQMQEEIKTLHREMGTTFIYVTHDQEEALNMSDRICLLEKGRIAQYATPEDIYFFPSSRFVAEFVGESNILTGRIDDDDSLTTDAGLKLNFHRSRHIKAASLPAQSPAEAMIRPENIHLGREAHGPASLPGSVKTVSFVGSTTRIVVDAGPHGDFISKVTSTSADRRLSIGDDVWIHWEAGDCVLLGGDAVRQRA